MNYNYKKEAKILYNELVKSSILKQIEKMVTINDEPKFSHYFALLDFSKSIGIKPVEEVVAAGVSFKSKYLALLKCLGESIERYSLFAFKQESLVFSKFINLKTKALNPSIYTDSPLTEKVNFGWIKGFSLTNNKEQLIPAQLAILRFKTIYREPLLTSPISTGAAGGFDRESTILRAIYEIIERDAAMTMYLNKIKTPQIDIGAINNKLIQSISSTFKKYKLEWALFDITNDLKIPVFLSILIDRTGIGPALCLTAKASLHIEDAIIGSIEECLMIRLGVRFLKFRNQSDNHKIDPTRLVTLNERSLYWSTLDRLDKLSFFLDQVPRPIKIKKLNITPKQELNTLIKMISESGYEISYVDITPDLFKKTGYLIYKVIIPGLQPLYIVEKEREFVEQRLKKVAKYFGKNKFKINKFPHPFL